MLKNLKMDLLYNPAILPSDITQRNENMYLHTKMFTTSIRSGISCNSQSRNHRQSTNERINSTCNTAIQGSISNEGAELPMYD